MSGKRVGQAGFSLVELLVSLAIVSILVGLLLPLLSMARDAARTTLCASNLKQIGFAWQLYLDEHGQFPRHGAMPDFTYGGVEFVGPQKRPVLAAGRPINHYLTEEQFFHAESFALMYRCPSDRGVFDRRGGHPVSALGDLTCFEYFGTSYRGNIYLMDSTRAGIDPLGRPLRLHETDGVAPSRLLLTGDAGWFYATRRPGEPGSEFEASWHGKPGGGNMLAVDGSVRFIEFEPGETSRYALFPRPQRRTPPEQ
jgi:prepilin-type N-terminal cleavage/methylation domain-containing protein